MSGERLLPAGFGHCYIGIDPGVSGGVAALDGSGHVLLAQKMPPTPADLWKLLELLGQSEDAFCVMEKVTAFAMPGRKMGATSAMTFGRGIGHIEMALIGNKIPYDPVIPQTWQKALACLTRGDKNVSKARAQQLFPALAAKITHATADALLLAEYCRRIRMYAPKEN